MFENDNFILTKHWLFGIKIKDKTNTFKFDVNTLKEIGTSNEVYKVTVIQKDKYGFKQTRNLRPYDYIENIEGIIREVENLYF